MKKWFLSFGFIICTCWAFPQTYEDWLKQEQERYKHMVGEQAKGMAELQRDYDEFVKKRDEEFAEFLKQRWTEYQVFKGEIPLRLPEPKIAPVIKEPSLKESVRFRMLEPARKDERLIFTPSPRIKKSGRAGYAVIRSEVNFYGNRLPLVIDRDLCRPYNGKLVEADFSAYWLSMSRANYDDLLDDLFQWKQQWGLNDWGYYMLLNHCAENLLNDDNSRQLLVWFLLNKSGYMARIGYGGNEVSVLLPAVQDIFFLSFIMKDGVRYYITRPINKSLFTYDKNFTGSNRCPDLRFSSSLNFSERASGKCVLDCEGQKFTITYSKAAVDFYKDYPSTELEVYFNAPVSALLKESLEENFRSLLASMQPRKRAEWLLKLLHKAFPYKTDEVQFGQEKYFFAEEMFAYPYSDCEDRAILFSRLAEMLGDMPGIGLSYPGHVASAILLPEATVGDYVEYRNKRYIICDPTYLGASVGMGMPEFAGKVAEVIPIETGRVSIEREERVLALVRRAGGTIVNRSGCMLFMDNGEVYVTGVFDEHFNTGIHTLVPPAKNNMIFVAKIDQKDRFEWVLPLGGKGVNRPQYLKADGDRLLLSGTFEEKGEFGSFNLQAEAGYDLFIAGIAKSGQVLWAAGAGLRPSTEKQDFNYMVHLGNKGEVLGREVQPDAIGSFIPGIYMTRKDEILVTGTFSQWGRSGRLFASGKQLLSTADMSGELKEINDRQIQHKADKGLAGLLAVLSVIVDRDIPVSGRMMIQSLDKYNPLFKERCPDLYENMGRIDFIPKENGIIQLKTLNEETVILDKVQVKDGSQMRIEYLPENNVKVEVIDGIQIGKVSGWFRLNQVILKHQTGNMVFDYDKDHTLRTFNISRDILK